MLKTLLAGTAWASLLALGAQAQQAPAEPDVTPPTTMEQQLPSNEPAARVIPETAGDTGGTPEAPAPDSLAQQPEAPAADAPAPDSLAEEPASPAPAIEGWAPVDMATVTTDTLIGKDIRMYDGDTIASVEDVLMMPDGKIEGIVARYGGFLGFGETRVLMDVGEVTVVSDADQNVIVLTGLSAEELKSRPEYIPPEG